MTTSKRSSERSAAMVLIFVIASSILVACAGGRADTGTSSGEVVLYTSVPEAIVDRLAGVVERRFPDLEGNYWVPAHGGISLRAVRGRTADIQQRIAEDIESTGGIQADVIWLAEPSPYEEYKDMGLLAPYELPEGTPIPAAYLDPDGFYVGGRVISMVLAWNTAALPAGLTDWPDLLDVESTAFPTPASGAARATIKALAEAEGPEYFSRLRSVGGVSVSSNGDARDGLVDGEFEAVAVLDYMVRGARESGAAVDFVYPTSGTVLIPSPIAITANAANPDAARVFVDFIVSQPGQEIVVQIGSFYPVRTDVAPPLGASPLADITALDVDWEALAGEADAIAQLWEDVYGREARTGARRVTYL